MNLTDMVANVRKDLHDENEENYRWTTGELERHIARAVKEFSQAIPLEQKATLATTAGSREISVSTLTGRVMIEAVEYPVGQFPPSYQRFALWNETLTLLGSEIPDGSNCYIYYGKLHTLSAGTSTLPTQHEDLVACGAEGYAAIELAAYTVNQVNTGGEKTPGDWYNWGKDRLSHFRNELKRLGRNNRVRATRLYTPYDTPVSKSTDWGP
jgi:hypothetical protein